MTPWLRNTLIGLGLIGFGLVLGLDWSAHRAGAKARAAQTQSDQHEGAAQTHAAQAAAQDQQAIKDQATVTTADARAAAAKRELDRRLAALHGDAPASHLAPLPTVPGTDELAATRAALAQAQAVIAAQGDQLAARDQLIASLRASDAHWHAAYDESQKALALQKIASEAAVHSEAKRGFLHSLETGLVCAAAGYASGRLQR